MQADCDLKATNIILQGLPYDIYSLVNHHIVAKDLWEIIQLLMQDTSLTKQEWECKLYHAFDKFAHVKEESIHPYYLIYTQLINDMNIHKKKLEQFQVNTMFLNSLPPEWRSWETNLYTLSIGDMMASSPMCLLFTASKTKSWLWHRRLSHLNFYAINHLAKHGLVRGLPKLQFEKYHLCSACAMGKSKKQSHQTKSEGTNQEKLYLLHMDLCGSMRVASINGKKYILVIVDDYSRFTWVKFLASKDEAPDFIIKRDRTLVEAARTMLIFTQAPLFLWAEEIATACYTKNLSIIRRRHGKTPYELLHARKPDLSYLYVFGALCYPNNDRPGLQCMTPTTASSGLVPKPIPQQPCIPPLRDDWDRLFQPMFDEYYNPLTIDVSLVPVTTAPRAIDLADSPVSTSINQDAPSTSIPSSQEHEHSPIISQGFEESLKTPHFHDEPLHESLHEDSTSQGSSSNVRPIHTLFESLGRWTKDHPIENIIKDHSRSVSTRKKLQTDAMWCYFDAFLTSIEPNNFKQAMTESSWIDAMQEEIHEFKRLQVWELVI
uniref:Retrovirus-related Pol polyprotein from transposon TNT 1-94 n=1 Tax=Tanacetum cinerariifolium TaxID=118510 RepID=A0A699I4Z8_TANCI|nr:retrovirus-related Pol polyprotein from transposon TNT 1-94 [Tanacetum cinerariifolium]